MIFCRVRKVLETRALGDEERVSFTFCCDAVTKKNLKKTLWLTIAIYLILSYIWSYTSVVDVDVIIT